jgi:DNA processing protein
LVALAHLVVVVQAGFRSGARNAAATTRRLGRPLFVVPHAPWDEKGHGCVLELKRGARVLESAKDVFCALAEAGLHALGPARTLADITPAQAALPFSAGACDVDSVLEAVRNGADCADAIAHRTGLGVGVIQHRLLTLSLAGVLVLDPSGRIRLL